MPHGLLGTERVAVRRRANAGKGFRETHGLLGNLRKLLYATVKWSHDALPTGTQRISEKIRASVRFSAIPCPASVCGERHAVRCRATGKLPPGHQSTPVIPALQWGSERSTGGVSRLHWSAPAALPRPRSTKMQLFETYGDFILRTLCTHNFHAHQAILSIKHFSQNHMYHCLVESYQGECHDE